MNFQTEIQNTKSVYGIENSDIKSLAHELTVPQGIFSCLSAIEAWQILDMLGGALSEHTVDVAGATGELSESRGDLSEVAGFE